MNIKVKIVLVLMLLAATSCMATRFSDVWKDESYRKGPVNNVLVIALLPSPETSKMVEDETAKQLRAHGINTVLGYAEFSGKLPSREVVLSRLGKLGVDSVLVTKLSGKETKSYQDYPDSYKAVLEQWEGPFSPTSPLIAAEPQDYALMQTNLYDAETQKIIWSALTETWIVGTDSRLVSSFVSTVIEKLAEDKFIR